MTVALARRRTLTAMASGFVLCRTAPARAAPDEDILGKAAGYPIGTPATWFEDRVKVGSFSQTDRIFPTHRLPHAAVPRPLARAEKPVPYGYRLDGKSRSIDDFLARRRITGLMVVKDGIVQVERCQYDRTPAHRFVSHSMAKSVTSLAVGFALAEGRIRSIDDKASLYAPVLAGSAYGDTPIRALLRMGSALPSRRATTARVTSTYSCGCRTPTARSPRCAPSASATTRRTRSSTTPRPRP